MSIALTPPPKDTFHYCPRCGVAGNVAPPGKDWFDCATCRYRFHFNAAVSVSAMIARPDGHLYMIRRARNPGQGKLAFPGGFVDPYESAETAVIRETREEVGMAVERLEYLTSWPNPYTYRGIVYPVLDLFYIAYVPEPTEKLATDEVTEAYWLNLEALSEEDYAFDSVRVAVAAYRKHA